MTSRSLSRLIKPYYYCKNGLRFDHHHSPSLPRDSSSIHQEFLKEQQRQKETAFRCQVIEQFRIQQDAITNLARELGIQNALPMGIFKSIDKHFKE